ncbi:hypothetical protein EV200_10761 [Pedobacter psychrotolerans]|uniref:Uncharacterized protein n=1 Tax=Pedobacter psychrotolerans TaxID=1843235 RepID=A0A4R2H604_9SPHI|nr:hypothetical protein [Pedobacter psychrotolerans]TCO21470.1 hypothetical protein EV200_10761 [Pedobacter psychrotolerans]GGE38918.1 hypothetical protein GCM10011413_00580 [Pedobacter psychrotolerans]
MKSPLSIHQKVSLLAACVFTLIAPILGYLSIGLAPVIIVGGSAIIGLICWYTTYLRKPVEPGIILPLFILTVAGLQIHIVEEYLMGFAPAMSRLFGIPWSEKSFLMVFALIGPVIYTLTSLGLYYKVYIAGFIAWFIFIGPGVAEFTHFIFPLISPDLLPHDPHSITAFIDGTNIPKMPNFYFKTTGHYYFPGMWTAVLPMIPGCMAIYRLLIKKGNTVLGQKSDIH